MRCPTGARANGPVVIPIMKQTQPSMLLSYRKRSDSSYRDMPTTVKLAIKKQLYKEQGGLCAYCMSRLPEEALLQAGDDRITIEHWAPRHPIADGATTDPLDYKNMLAVCEGNRHGGSRGKLVCDAAKGNTPITVNPLVRETLEGIYYTSDGGIHSRNADVDFDLTTTLNLNCVSASLPLSRKSALNSLQAYVNRQFRGKPATKEGLRRILNKYESQTDKKSPYVGILTWWLRKRLKRQ